MKWRLPGGSQPSLILLQVFFTMIEVLIHIVLPHLFTLLIIISIPVYHFLNLWPGNLPGHREVSFSFSRRRRSDRRCCRWHCHRQLWNHEESKKAIFPMTSFQTYLFCFLSRSIILRSFWILRICRGIHTDERCYALYMCNWYSRPVAWSPALRSGLDRANTDHQIHEI